MNIIREIQKDLVAVKDLPVFGAGDTISVSYKIIE
jgi:ribosomal protein L19